MTKKILFVDDDPIILRSFKRYTGLEFNVETALGGEAGLKMLTERGPYAVIVSDMRMPGMDGVKFLSEVRERCPESVRMLLTGQADLNDAIAVVNEGQIFRFLTKPCPPEIFNRALKEGIEMYRLITSEKELLDKTLKGSIKVLIDILSIANPEAFSRSSRVRKIANKIASRLKLSNAWQVDLAASLSQIGCVTVPLEILSKKYTSQPLSKSETEIFAKQFQIGSDLLSNIPRLEEIAEAIAYQEKQFDGGGIPSNSKKGKEIPLIARILKVVHDYDDLVMTEKSHAQALEEMYFRKSWYDPDILSCLKEIDLDFGYVIKEVEVKNLKTGMVLAEDVRTKTNLLLVRRMQEVSETTRMAILNFAENNNIVQPVKILEYGKR